MSYADFADPGFWITLVIGVAALACFVFWLLTGGRKAR